MMPEPTPEQMAQIAELSAADPDYPGDADALASYGVAVEAMREQRDYAAFLADKQPRAIACGFEPHRLPAALKPFQRDLTTWAVRRGRAAIFAGTGLGKTLMQLSWAQQVADHTNRPVLILTPLAVAQQTVAEAKRFGIDGVAYAADRGAVTGPIVVTNYDRFHKFDVGEFSGIVLDESSLIKASDSKTRRTLIESCVDIDYRLCCTATPAPNDWAEIGNHSEFLGVMNDKEMLAMFFVHDGGIRADGASAEWRLKRHAERDFWAWMASWAAMVRHPRDLGYDEPGYDLPPLIKHQVTVAADMAPINGMLFPTEARTLSERLGARRDTIGDRVAAAASIVNAAPDRPWLVWCNLNDEADALAAAIPGAVEVRGTDDRDVKAERLLGFAEGRIRIMLTKPKLGAHGLNLQVCADMVFVGLNDSFEQLFQAIRRCWRFGQTRPVNVYLVASELEGAVVKNLAEKEAAFERMAEAMAVHMRDLTVRAVRGGRVSTTFEPSTNDMELPAWLTQRAK